MLEMSRIGSCTKSFRDDLPNCDMIFSEESSRAIYEIGNLELIELRQNLGDYSVSFLPEARTTGIEHASMRRLAFDPIRAAFAALKTPYYRTAITRQPMADGPSQSQRCKNNETPRPHLCVEPMAKRQNIPSFCTVGLRRTSSISTTSP